MFWLQVQFDSGSENFFVLKANGSSVHTYTVRELTQYMYENCSFDGRKEESVNILLDFSLVQVIAGDVVSLSW